MAIQLYFFVIFPRSYTDSLESVITLCVCVCVCLTVCLCVILCQLFLRYCAKASIFTVALMCCRWYMCVFVFRQQLPSVTIIVCMYVCVYLCVYVDYSVSNVSTDQQQQQPVSNVHSVVVVTVWLLTNSARVWMFVTCGSLLLWWLVRLHSAWG